MRQLAPMLLLALAGCVLETVPVCAPEDYETDPMCREGCDLRELPADQCPEIDSCFNTCDTASAEPYCDRGRCVTCALDEHCDGATPVCDTIMGVCVECFDNDHCAGACDLSTRLCAECVIQGQCPSASASSCNQDSLTCVACSSNAHCTHLPGLPFCSSGECVGCTAATEAQACLGNSCDTATGDCTDTPVATVATCGACVADSECADSDDRCVAMNYQGTPLGGFCLRRMAATCAAPFTTAIVGGTLSGGASETFCGIDQTVASCAAVLGVGEACVSGNCNGDGARCETVGAAPNLCTYSCASTADCPSGGSASTCAGGYCGS